LWVNAQQASVYGSVSAWLKALKPFQSRPDLIRVSAPANDKGAAVAAKSATRKRKIATQTKTKASVKSAHPKVDESKSRNAKKPQ